MHPEAGGALAAAAMEHASRALAASSGEEEGLGACRFELPHVQFGWAFLLQWMTILGILSAATEGLMSFLEEQFREQRTNIKILRRMYRELTVLGIISFSIMVIRDASRGLTINDLHLIEFAHLWLFTVGITFIFTNAMLAILLRSAKVFWDDAFAYGLHKLELRYHQLASQESMCHRIARYLLPFYRFERRRLVDKVNLWVLRRDFINRNNLPESFHFSKYLRRSLTRSVLKELKLGWDSWAFLAFCFLVGFGVAKSLDPELAYLDLDASMEFILAIMGLLFLSCLMMNRLIKWGLIRFLRIVAGAPSSHHLERLLAYAKEIHDKEQSSIMDPTGQLTADEVRLDEIFEEAKGHDKMRFSSEFATQHIILDRINVNTYTATNILPLAYAFLFTKAFRILILAQGYAVGFTILVAAQFKADLFVGWRLAVLAAIFALAIVQVTLMIPRTMRDYALLSAVARVDREALDVIDGTFMYQKDTNDSIYILANILYNTSEVVLRGLYVVEGVVPPETRSQAVAALFTVLDKHRKGIVPPLQLQAGLEQQPFRRHLRTARLRMVLRSLNCERGLTLDRCKFLVHGMERLIRKDRRSISKFTRCFGGVNVPCARCRERIPASEIDNHADECRGSKSTSFMQGVIDEDEDDESEEEDDDEDGGESSDGSVPYAASSTSFDAEGGNDSEHGSISAMSTFHDRVSVARDAKFGLLLPFALPKSRLEDA
ncbi:Hypothetical Protein FCC1311_021222 [Hondaea fermentalgiana]|uniref:EF-hand domain-containing protein n=1 Tax=Hondaea fermentalgiana TaxID=2315210 RepID=A0A2R5GBF0_9STRA|nr:Hypothetical Protein FCC1311_021222 [Hondaea fermentalgiana]|eukprot:GBG25903.1 Hypothetical Protein FCC1311_021222 [Hondaea fermentalgiana]